MTSYRSAFQELIAKVQSVPTMLQGEMQGAAKRAVEKTNRQLMQSNIPVRADLASRGTGYRLQLRQIGPLTKRFSGSTPQDVLQRNLREELAGALRTAREKL